ncbi:MAG: 50S ribosomal protein L32, partial [Actinobacteria bacterium]|nr:50S ribosomal protein L32 [Actinomycetota bacterium]MSX16440.1 50S ribosomal protein L32 [Actinomycetota bacterium]MSX37094.1 50S ribosomal protein L32 [Actinomycetota bacterium]MSX78374.1 50S ribosomal protein L32 [Actinomycetota bacterium]MSZ72047.1 50S ribosomal protein L32 [Actinomycetota bacterium]
MAVPKRKKSKMKGHSHQAGAWKLEAPSRSLCPRCG